MRRVILIAGLVAGCGGLPRLTPIGSTLLVRNEGLGLLVLRDNVGRLATLTPGQQRCVTLRRVEASQALSFTIEGRTYTTPVFIPSTYAGWRLAIGTVPRFSAFGLVPLDSPCNPSARRSTAEVQR